MSQSINGAGAGSVTPRDLRLVSAHILICIGCAPRILLPQGAKSVVNKVFEPPYNVLSHSKMGYRNAPGAKALAIFTDIDLFRP